jgi:hypothetical protein
MKQISLNEDQIQTLKTQCHNIEDLIQQLESDQSIQGHVICQFVINGIKLSDSDELRMKSFQITDLSSITLLLDKPENLLKEIIQNWKNEIPKIIAHADGLASLIREKGIDNQISSFIQLVESCQLLVQSLMSLSHVIDTQKVFETGQWFLSEKMLAEAVGETLEGFSQKDSKNLADIIEYDLANSLVYWLEIFEKLDQYNESEISLI